MLVKTLGFLIGGFVFGVFIHSVFFNTPITTTILMVVFILGMVILFFKNKSLFLVAMCILGIGLGLARYRASIGTDKQTVLDVFVSEEESVSLIGNITSDPIGTPSYTEFIFQTEHMIKNDQLLNLDTKILARTDTYTDYQYGDTVRVTGKLDKPESFTTDTGRIFDYAAYLSKDDVYYTMSFADTSLLGKGKGFIHNLFGLKHTFLNAIYRIIPEPESGLLAGILFGQKKSLGESYEDKFRLVGLMHIVVLSGYNVALVIQLLLKTLSFLPVKTRSLVAVCGIAIFALLVGAGPTVIRASIMAVFIVLADVVGAQYNIKRALVIAGIIMVVWNPKILYFDISFQLSFLATYGLVAFSPWLERKFSFLPKFLAIRDSAVATIAAQIMVMPLILYSIGQLSIISPIVNVLVLFAVPWAMFVGFATALVSFVSLGLAVPIGIVATYLLKYQLFVVDIFSRLPFASVTVPPFHATILVVLYVLIFWWIRHLNRIQKI